MPFDSGCSPLVLEPGDCVGGYELLRELGRGGMAEVWLARRTRSSTGKFVAIKLILPQYVGVERYSRMFASEAEVAAPLSHSNICQVFDEGEERGRSYLVMEWVDGADLAQLLPAIAELRRRDPQLRLRVAAYVIGQVLHGLSYAHKIQSHRGKSLGIVHRDISPQNVLVSVSGDVKVTDFGIAHRMIEETSGINVKGKLRYMAPEQLEGRSHEPTVDLFAVGAIFHELLAGEKFRSDADGQAALYHRVMSGHVPPAPSDVPPELEAVRRALLDPDPAKRPQTADAAVLMLKRWIGYSEMRVELGTLCGLAIGVIRPRTGPIVAAGQPTVPPRASRSSSSVRAVSPEADAPVAHWGVSREATVLLAEAEHHESLRPANAPPPIAARDLEPTHSSVELLAASAAPVVDVTVSQLDVEPPRGPRPWMLGVAAGVLAALGAGGTALYLALASTPASAHRLHAAWTHAPTLALAIEDVVPDLAPAAELAAIESAAAPEATPPVAPKIEAPPPEIAAPKIEARQRETAKVQKPAPRKSARKVEPIAAGPEVTVHFRLEQGLGGADVKLGKHVIAVRPRYDGRIPSGKYAAKFRVATTDKWRDAGVIEIGASGEWKLLLGPSGARVRKL